MKASAKLAVKKAAICAGILLSVIALVYHTVQGMTVYDGADITVTPSACPVALEKSGECHLVGQLSHEFISGKALVDDGKNKYAFTDAQFESINYGTQDPRYEPLGKAGLWVACLIIAVVGVFLAFAVPYISLDIIERKKREKALGMSNPFGGP